MRDKLIEDLTAARRIYEKDVRLGATVAVDAMIQHLDALEIDPKLWVPLVGLAGALGDAMVGVHNPHLEVDKPQADAPRRAIQNEVGKAWAAAAVSLLMRAGDTQPQALHRVAPLIGMSSAELQNFRKRVTRDNGKQVRDEVRKAYDTAMSAHVDVLGPSTRQVAEAAVITIKNMTGR